MGTFLENHEQVLIMWTLSESAKKYKIGNFSEFMNKFWDFFKRCEQCFEQILKRDSFNLWTNFEIK